MPTPSHTLVVIALLAFLAVANIDASAADTLRMPANTTLQEGQIVRITVTGFIESEGPQRLTISYPANAVRIRNVVGGSGYAWNCGSVQINSDDVVGDVGFLERSMRRCASPLLRTHP